MIFYVLKTLEAYCKMRPSLESRAPRIFPPDQPILEKHRAGPGLEKKTWMYFSVSLGLVAWLGLEKKLDAARLGK